MIEMVSWTLPQYKQHLYRFGASRPGVAQERLVKLMCYIYAEIVQFCQEVYFMFSQQKRYVDMFLPI
jgi:hypothetical protein